MRKPSLRKAVSVLSLLVLGGIALRAWFLHSFLQTSEDHAGLMMMRYIYYPTYSRLDGLIMGVSLALIRTFRTPWWSWIARHSGMLALVGLAVVLGGLWLCDFNYPAPDLPLSILFAFPALACGFGLLVASAGCERGVLRARVPGASLLAAVAFSLYLTHKSVAHATHHLLPGLTAEAGWQSFTIYILACLATAALLYVGVERPCLALRARQGARMAPGRIERERKLDPAL